MEKIDKIIEFLVENSNDSRVSIYKKMKYGFRYYIISFSIDEDPNRNLNQNSHFYQLRDSMEITFDNRNECIEVVGGNEDFPIIIENKLLLKKWSEVLEAHVSQNIEERVVDVFETSLNQCHNKNLYRELQLKKLYKDDESI